jgi:hypothetical protein
MITVDDRAHRRLSRWLRNDRVMSLELSEDQGMERRGILTRGMSEPPEPRSQQDPYRRREFHARIDLVERQHVHENYDEGAGDAPTMPRLGSSINFHVVGWHRGCLGVRWGGYFFRRCWGGGRVDRFLSVR